MGSLGIVVLAIVGTVGVGLCFGGATRIVRRKVISGSTFSLSGVVLTLLAGLGLGVASNLYTYQRFTHEQPVAELQFQRISDARFVARLEEPSGDIRHWELQGDEWQLDARVLRWHGVATLMGFDPLYRLERISGRHGEVSRERTETRTAYALSEDASLDLWRFARHYQQWLPWVDATYGSATYLPMADNARYAVRLNAGGLIARPLNSEGEGAVRNW